LFLDARRAETEQRNLPLGLVDDSLYDQFTEPLGPGDVVCLYTDALIEATDPAGRMLGEEGLLGAARRLDASTPTGIAPALLASVDDHRGGRKDDLHRRRHVQLMSYARSRRCDRHRRAEPRCPTEDRLRERGVKGEAWRYFGGVHPHGDNRPVQVSAARISGWNHARELRAAIDSDPDPGARQLPFERGKVTDVEENR
jgi:hypothetical protein